MARLTRRRNRQLAALFATLTLLAVAGLAFSVSAGLSVTDAVATLGSGMVGTWFAGMARNYYRVSR